jgi:hypothetical protein
MKKLSLALMAGVLIGANSTTVHAGNLGGGGGTNIVKSTGQLTDFQKYGRVIQQIDPLEFEGIYKELKPRLDQLEYLMPGLTIDKRSTGDDSLTAVFHKTWLVTDKTFPPRSYREAKPINQTEDLVLINSEWLLTADHQKLVEAWIHEMVRGFVYNTQHYKRVGGLGLYWTEEHMDANSVEFLDSVDTLVETLTPLVALQTSPREITKQFQRAFFNFSQKYLSLDTIPTREGLYYTIGARKLDRAYSAICLDDELNSPERTVAKLNALSPFANQQKGMPVDTESGPYKSRSEYFRYAGKNSELGMGGIFFSPQRRDLGFFQSYMLMAIEGLKFETGERIRPLSTNERTDLAKKACSCIEPMTAQIIQDFINDGRAYSEPQTQGKGATSLQDIRAKFRDRD